MISIGEKILTQTVQTQFTVWNYPDCVTYHVIQVISNSTIITDDFTEWILNSDTKLESELGTQLFNNLLEASLKQTHNMNLIYRAVIHAKYSPRLKTVLLDRASLISNTTEFESCITYHGSTFSSIEEIIPYRTKLYKVDQILSDFNDKTIKNWDQHYSKFKLDHLRKHYDILMNELVAHF